MICYITVPHDANDRKDKVVISWLGTHIVDMCRVMCSVIIVPVVVAGQHLCTGLK